MHAKGLHTCMICRDAHARFYKIAELNVQVACRAHQMKRSASPSQMYTAPSHCRSGPAQIPLPVTIFCRPTCVIWCCTSGLANGKHWLSVQVPWYTILGNHDYGDKCYDEQPGCYPTGDLYYSPNHQVRLRTFFLFQAHCRDFLLRSASSGAVSA